MTEIDSSQPFAEQFEVKEDLGKGAFSIVRKVQLIKTGVNYAAKIINTKRLSARDLQKLEREVRICRMLKHNNIVQLHNVFQDGHVRYMIFDLITGGELFDDIVAREFYSEKDASTCIQQILESVRYCHENGIIHRDIKPENLLLSSKGEGAVVKLADFGLAVEAQDKKHYYGFAGTPGYLSPEVLRKEPYDKAVDIWACGVVLYILLVGYPPFWDDDQGKMFEQIKAGKYEYLSPEWDTVSDKVKHLIDGMLTMDPDRRLTADAALKDQWIANRDRIASVVHRQETIAGLRKFNARRKLKAAMHTAMIISRRSSALMNPSSTRSNPVSPRTSTTSLLSPSMEPLLLNLTTPEEKEIVTLTQQLLNAIAERDYSEYCKLCSDTLTCFEPEACSQLITGLDFHKFYFDNIKTTASQQTIINPKLHILSETSACIAYTRISQYIDLDGVAQTTSSNETRLWKKIDGQWKNIHFHRS